MMFVTCRSKILARVRGISACTRTLARRTLMLGGPVPFLRVRPSACTLRSKASAVNFFLARLLVPWLPSTTRICGMCKSTEHDQSMESSVFVALKCTPLKSVYRFGRRLTVVVWLLFKEGQEKRLPSTRWHTAWTAALRRLAYSTCVWYPFELKRRL